MTMRKEDCGRSIRHWRSTTMLLYIVVDCNMTPVYIVKYDFSKSLSLFQKSLSLRKRFAFAFFAFFAFSSEAKKNLQAWSKSINDEFVLVNNGAIGGGVMTDDIEEQLKSNNALLTAILKS